jgi:hypothetical protein
MAEGSHHSRPTSWAAVIVMILGFVIGGLGLILGEWWMFWLGGAVVVAGGIFGLANGIMNDVH